jgi:hypothetical protein
VRPVLRYDVWDQKPVLTFWARWAIVRRRNRFTLRNVLEDLRYLFRG